MALPPHAPLVLLAAVVGSGVALFAWVFRETPAARPLAAFMIAASLWALAEGMTLVSPNLETKVYWARMTATVSVLVPVAWLVTVLAYTDAEWGLTRTWLAALLVEPAVFAALVWTNVGPGVERTAWRHDLVWTDFSTDAVGSAVVLLQEYGLAYWGHVAYGYALVAVGALALVRTIFRTNRTFRSHATALLVAIFVPALARALSLYGAVPAYYDLTSIGFVGTGLVLTWAITRGELLAVTPATRHLGREAVVEGMDDRVLILDAEDRVVDVNPAGARLLGADSADVVGQSLADVNPALAAALDGQSKTELAFDAGDGVHHYDVRVSQLHREYGGVAGRVVSLRDVTERRQREQRLDVLNRLLRHNIRNELNVVRGNATMVADDVEDAELEARLDRIVDTVDRIVERSGKVAAASRLHERTDTDSVGLRECVEALVDDVAGTYDAATFSVDVPDGLVVESGPTLERALRELLENAAEHGGPGVSVTVTATRAADGHVEIRVADDGPGIPEGERAAIERGRETDLQHGSGVGLWVVTWAVRALGGTVSFADRSDGCTVVVHLPTVDESGDGEPPESADHATVTGDANAPRDGASESLASPPEPSPDVPSDGPTADPQD